MHGIEIAQSFAQSTEHVKAQSKAADGAGGLSARFIHLAPAKYLVPGQDAVPSNIDSIFWRGRLSAISGFSLGEFSVRKWWGRRSAPSTYRRLR